MTMIFDKKYVGKYITCAETCITFDGERIATKGKKYQIKGVDANSFYIKSDSGNRHWFGYDTQFFNVKNFFRQDKLNNL